MHKILIIVVPCIAISCTSIRKLSQTDKPVSAAMMFGAPGSVKELLQLSDLSSLRLGKLSS